MSDIEFIQSKIPPSEMFCQLAEEAAELAQAALKLHRIYDCTNPTPVKMETAYENLLEEIADVSLVLDALGFDIKETKIAIGITKIEKLGRWVERLKESGAKP